MTAAPPAFQQYAIILLLLPFTDPQLYKVPRVNPLSSKETKSCVAPLVYSVLVLLEANPFAVPLTTSNQAFQLVLVLLLNHMKSGLKSNPHKTL